MEVCDTTNVPESSARRQARTPPAPKIGDVFGAQGAVVFADLCGFAALTDALGDEAAADMAVRLCALARRALAPGALLLKTLGDGVLIVAAQRAAARDTAEHLRDLVRADPSMPPVRLGICEGPIVWRNGDVYGATVNKAARAADVAVPWEIRSAAQGAPATLHTEEATEG
jgi:class 3 adenylate cyclase